MIENLGEIISNKNDNQPKTRLKKINPKYKNYDEDSRRDLKLSKLSILEEDDEVQKEDKDDSDYEMDEDGGDKKKRARKITTKAVNEVRFGKINVLQYFNKEVVAGKDDAFPNYYNIQIKPLTTNKSGNNISYKICNVCFGFANYTCPRCGDRYCSKECFKTHKEVKCIKYIEL